MKSNLLLLKGQCPKISDDFLKGQNPKILSYFFLIDSVFYIDLLELDCAIAHWHYLNVFYLVFWLKTLCRKMSENLFELICLICINLCII
jgi:hypothetical protein